MRTQLRPPDVPVKPGDVTTIDIEVANASDVIDGVTARVEGIDPSWVHLPVPVLSLFPDSSGLLPIQVRFPPSTIAGEYLVVVHVESTIDSSRHSTHDLWLQVEPVEDATLRLRPSVVTGGKAATFSAIVANRGNVPIDFTMSAVDETRVLDCSAVPLTLRVDPAREGIAEIDLRGRRPWFGQPVARTVTVAAQSTTLHLREVATFNQRPRIPRGVLTALILASIVGLWAFIFLYGVNLLRSGAAPTKAVAANFNTGGVQEIPLAAISATAMGKVTAETTGDGLARITVEAYRVTPDGEPELSGSGATAEDGTYSLGSLLPGTYHLRYTAEGFQERWYPGVATQAEAQPVELEPKEDKPGLDITMAGQSGTLVGTIELPEGAAPGQLATVTLTQAVEQTPEPGEPAPPPPVTMTIQTAGPVEFSGLPTPATYTVLVEAEGFAPQEAELTLGGGATDVLNTVRPAAATGSITGTVRSSSGAPIGNVDVLVTSGELERTATTPTIGDVGSFVIDGLPTPRTYVLTFSLDGFSGQTIALDLAAGENRTGVDALLVGGTGTITGAVTDTRGLPLGGVKVTVTRGDFLAETSTLTTAGPGAGVGSYSVTDIPTPGSFAVTFSLPGYIDETQSVGFLVPTTQSGISATLRRADATITGTIAGPSGPLVGATVELSDGRTSRTTSTASAPQGGYTFTGVAPGSYTLTVSAPGAARQAVLLRVAAGDELVRDVAVR